jgi:transposase
MIARSWDGLRTTAIARELQCPPQTVRERLLRVTVKGLDGLGDRPGPGRKPRRTEAERSGSVGLVATPPPGRLVPPADGALVAAAPERAAPWTLDALPAAARERAITVGRSQVRRILLREGARGRHPRAWATSTDPEFAPTGSRSSPATPRRRPRGRSAAPTSAAR